MVMRLRPLIGASAAQQSADVGSSHVIGHLTQHHHCGACRDGPSNSHSLTRTWHEMPDTFCDACLQHPAINVFGCSWSSLKLSVAAHCMASASATAGEGDLSFHPGNLTCAGFQLSAQLRTANAGLRKVGRLPATPATVSALRYAVYAVKAFVTFEGLNVLQGELFLPSCSLDGAACPSLPFRQCASRLWSWCRCGGYPDATQRIPP